MNAPLSPDGRQFWNGSEWRPVPQGVDKFWNGTEWQTVPKQPGPPEPTPQARREHAVRTRSNWHIPAIALGVAGGISLALGALTATGDAADTSAQHGFFAIGLVLLAVCVVFAILDNRAKRK